MPWSHLCCEMLRTDAVCAAARRNPLVIWFSHLSLLLLVWYLKYLSDLLHPLLFWIFFSCSCFLFFFSSNLSSCSYSSLLYLKTKTFLRKKPAPFPWPLHIFLVYCQSVSQPHFSWSVISDCDSVWPSDRSIPMWLSSPQGTVQVSRPGWRIPTLSVTNAFGWSAESLRHVVPLRCWNMATITAGTLQVR